MAHTATQLWGKEVQRPLDGAAEDWGIPGQALTIRGKALSHTAHVAPLHVNSVAPPLLPPLPAAPVGEESHHRDTPCAPCHLDQGWWPSLGLSLGPGHSRCLCDLVCDMGPAVSLQVSEGTQRPPPSAHLQRPGLWHTAVGTGTLAP